MAGLCGPSLGSWAWMITSQLTARQPAARPDRRPPPGAACCRAPSTAGRCRGNARRCRPGRPRPEARRPPHGRPRRRRNDPTRPRGCSIRSPPRINGRPSSNRCVSWPIPTRKLAPPIQIATPAISNNQENRVAFSRPPDHPRYATLRRIPIIGPAACQIEKKSFKNSETGRFPDRRADGANAAKKLPRHDLRLLGHSFSWSWHRECNNPSPSRAA